MAHPDIIHKGTDIVMKNRTFTHFEDNSSQNNQGGKISLLMERGGQDLR